MQAILSPKPDSPPRIREEPDTPQATFAAPRRFPRWLAAVPHHRYDAGTAGGHAPPECAYGSARRSQQSAGGESRTFLAGTAVAVLWPCIPGRPKCAVRRGWQAGGVTPPPVSRPRFRPPSLSSATAFFIGGTVLYTASDEMVVTAVKGIPLAVPPPCHGISGNGISRALRPSGCGSPACKGHGAVLFRAAAGTPGWLGQTLAHSVRQTSAGLRRTISLTMAAIAKERFASTWGRRRTHGPISPGHYATMPAPYTVCGASCAFEGSCTSCRCLPSGCSLPPTGSRTLPPAVCIY